jgi:hypothetical protein
MENNRKSHVRLVVTNDPVIGGDSVYVVDLYENDKLVQVRNLPGKSRSYAEDVAENWDSGIIQLLID